MTNKSYSKNLKRHLRALVVLAPLTLAGCAIFSKEAPPVVDIPDPHIEIPTDLRVCFSTLTEFPESSSLTRRQALTLILKLRTSEVDKFSCGNRLLDFMDDVASVHGVGVE